MPGMENTIFNSPLFGTIICLILIYALLSLLVSTVTEAVNSYFKERGTLLYNTISNLFNDDININFGQLIYMHPMIKNLRKNNTSLPQYISAAMFSKALIDVISNHSREYEFDKVTKCIALKEARTTIFERFANTVYQMQHTDLKLLLMNIVERSIDQSKSSGTNPDSSHNELEALNKQIQDWFNDQMDRTSGWYKTFMRTRLFWISLVVALILNVDSINLFQTIYRTPGLRAQLLPVAENLADNYAAQKADTGLTDLQRAYNAAANLKINTDSVKVDTTLINNTAKFISQLKLLDSLTRRYDSTRQKAFDKATSQIDQIAALGIPIGWKANQAPITWFKKYKPVNGTYFEMHKHLTFWNFIAYILGIIITAVSLSFGAPFWFDLLMKAVNLRRAGTKPSNG